MSELVRRGGCSVVSEVRLEALQRVPTMFTIAASCSAAKAASAITRAAAITADCTNAASTVADARTSWLHVSTCIGDGADDLPV